MNDLTTYEKLPKAFYQGGDVVEIAKLLLGKYVFAKIDGLLTAGRIVETEAYRGVDDMACHAHGKRTKRTETMYQAGGIAYVYLCYGIHHLLNIVTNVEDMADAVLIRAVEPVMGIDVMKKRRSKTKLKDLTSGPGVFCQAFGVTKVHDRTNLDEDKIWIAKLRDERSFDVETDRRVGVDYAGDDAFLPWRFLIKDNSYVSVKKRNP